MITRITTNTALLLLFVVTPLANAAHPYDSVGRLSPPGKTYGGSCVLVAERDGEGLIVTNGHVVNKGSKFEVYWPTFELTQPCETIGVVAAYDIAFLVVKDPRPKPVRVGVRNGNVIFAGFPSYDRTHLHWQRGDVQWEDDRQCCWRNTLVPGMSGGAVFDAEDGELCGINKAMKEPWGYGVADLPLLYYVQKYRTRAWTPDDSHVAKKLDFGASAKWDNKRIVTNKYNPDKAPDLDNIDD